MKAALAPILIVEDSDDDFDTIQEASRRASVPNPLVRATSLAEARAALGLAGATGPVPQLPALVMLDYNLPDGNGRDLLDDLAGCRDGAVMPIIVYTSSSVAETYLECYRAGANAYHTKAFRYEEALATLRDVFHYWLKLAQLPISIQGRPA